MTKESLRLKLKEFKDEIGAGCVSIAKYSSRYYYAVNGVNTINKEQKENENKKLIITLKNMYYTSAIFCNYENSISVIKINKYKGKKYYYNYNIKHINTKNGIMDISVIFDKIPLLKYSKSSPSFYNRNWSCAEKKIVGFINNMTPIINKGKYYNDYDIDFYVTKRPCILCTPLVSNVNYLDDKNNLKCYKYITNEVKDTFEVVLYNEGK